MFQKNSIKLSRNKQIQKENKKYKHSNNNLFNKNNNIYSSINLLNWFKKENDEKETCFSRDNNIKTFKLKPHNKSSSSITYNNKINIKKKSLNKTINNCRNSHKNNSFELMKYIKLIVKSHSKFNKRNIINKIEQTTIKDFINSMNISTNNFKSINISSINNKKNKIKNQKMNFNLNINNKKALIKSNTNKKLNITHKSKSKKNNKSNEDITNKIKIEEIKKENEKIKMNIEEENKKGKEYIDKIIELKYKKINLDKKLHKLKNDNKILSKTLEKLLVLIELLEANGLDINEIIENVNAFEEENDNDKYNNKKNNIDNKSNKNKENTISYGNLEIHEEFFGSKVPTKISNNIPKLKFNKIK